MACPLLYKSHCKIEKIKMKTFPQLVNNAYELEAKTAQMKDLLFKSPAYVRSFAVEIHYEVAALAQDLETLRLRLFDEHENNK